MHLVNSMLQLVHELPGRPSGTAAAADLPGGGRRPELLGNQVRSCPFGEDGDDLLIFLKGGGRIEKLQTEAAGKGQLFLYRIGAVSCSISLRSLHTSRTRWRRLEVAQIRTFSGGASAPPSMTAFRYL